MEWCTQSTPVADDEWRKGPWTAQEDKLLIEHVNLHGEANWNTVSAHTGLRRSGKSCRLRWVNYLRPDLKKGKITPEEESVIMELHALWGNRWSAIARSLPGRTDNEIKNYWRTHFKKSKPSKKLVKARAEFLQNKQRQQQWEDHDERSSSSLMITNQLDQLAALAQEAPLDQDCCVLQGGGAGFGAGEYNWLHAVESCSWPGSLWQLDDDLVQSGVDQVEDQVIFPSN